MAFPAIIAGLIRLYQERTKQPPLFGVEPLDPISKTKHAKANVWDGPDM